MNLRSIDLNLLPMFEAIYAERSLTRAAEALHVTQPALSNALTRLRGAFGDPLFVRSGRGMQPTPAAQALIGPVREALGRLRVSLDAREAFDPKTSERVFNIASRDTSASAILPALASKLTLAPGVRMQWHTVDRADIPLELASGALDFAIDVPVIARPEMDSAGLFRDRYVLALRPGHRHAKGRLSVEQFCALRHIVVSSRRTGRTPVDQAVGRLGARLRPAMRMDHYQPAFHAVMASDFALAAPVSLARRYEVAVRELPFEPPVLDVRLWWRREAGEDRAMEWARARIIEAARAK
jgi:DNA-binding transcriptional LysR family regulator